MRRVRVGRLPPVVPLAASERNEMTEPEPLDPAGDEWVTVRVTQDDGLTIIAVLDDE